MIKNLELQWNVLKELKKVDNPEVPKTTKALSVIKWNQVFGDYLQSIIEHRTTPLSCIFRKELTVPATLRRQRIRRGRARG